MADTLFMNSSSYDTLAYGDSVEVVMNENNDSIQYPIVVLPVGTVLHRADRTGATTPSDAVPAFFGNRKSIEVYAGTKGDEAYSSYKVMKPLHLFEMNFNSLRDLIFHPGMTDEDITLLKSYYRIEKGFVLPTIITSKENMKGPHPDYMNRKMARLICRLGFDGWIVMPFNVKKRKGLTQFVLSRKEEVPYMPEVMVCRWSEHMERLPAAIKGGRRQTRRRSRRMRQTRKRLA